MKKKKKIKLKKKKYKNYENFFYCPNHNIKFKIKGYYFNHYFKYCKCGIFFQLEKILEVMNNLILNIKNDNNIIDNKNNFNNFDNININNTNNN